jgi:phage gp29-like protein
VEAKVKDARTNACAKYVCNTINSQLIPSVLELNYGDREECPCMDLVPDSEAGAEEAQRDNDLAKLMPIPMSYLRAKYNVPEAAKGEETTMLHAPAAKTEDVKGPKVESLKVEEEDADVADLDDPTDDEDIAAKMAALLSIDDDAIFAKQLTALTDSLQ